MYIHRYDDRKRIGGRKQCTGQLDAEGGLLEPLVVNLDEIRVNGITSAVKMLARVTHMSI